MHHSSHGHLMQGLSNGLFVAQHSALLRVHSSFSKVDFLMTVQRFTAKNSL